MTSLYKINQDILEVLDSAEVNEETGEVIINLELLHAIQADKTKLKIAIKNGDIIKGVNIAKKINIQIK